MALIKRINTAQELKQEFKCYDRDTFSIETYQTLIDYFDSLEEEIELDIISLYNDFNESDYDTLRDEYEIDEDEDVLEYLQYRTYAVDLGDNNVLYLNF